MARSIRYRSDIDGLRAWAVMLVVIYHAGSSAVPGGFIGVDVFFVISGYLITKIIIEETAEGRFSLLQFYQRRARRIIPALLVLVIAVLASGIIVILPNSLERVATTALSTLLFFSNVHFWLQSANYFAPTSTTDPFLHAWSLSVEEQFYLVLAPIIMVLANFGRRFLIGAMAVLSLASFTLAILAYPIAPTATFFLPFTRAWEFFAGSFLAANFLPRPASRSIADLCTLGGLGVILLGAFFFDGSTPFPGWATLLPVVGAAMIIYFGSGSGYPAGLLLRWEPIRLIGLISYSLYLWHWPILVLAEYHVLGRPLQVAETVLCIGLSFVAATLSYRYVEQVFRRGRFFEPPRRMVAALLSATAAAVLLASIIIRSDGVSSRYPDFAEYDMTAQLESEAPLYQSLYEDCFAPDLAEQGVIACYLGPRGATNTLLWGDSFARHYLSAMVEYAGSGSLPEGRSLISLVTVQCPPIIGYGPVHLPRCKTANERAVEFIDSMNVDTVILAANWFNYALVNRVQFEDINETVSAMQSKGVRTVIIGQSPLFTFTMPEEALYRQVLSDVPASILGRMPASTDERFNRQLREEVSADLFFDPVPHLCSGDLCRFHGTGGYLFYDDGHLTLEGARLVVRPLMEDLQDSPPAEQK